MVEGEGVEETTKIKNQINSCTFKEVLLFVAFSFTYSNMLSVFFPADSYQGD